MAFPVSARTTTKNDNQEPISCKMLQSTSSADDNVPGWQCFWNFIRIWVKFSVVAKVNKHSYDFADQLYGSEWFHIICNTISCGISTETFIKLAWKCWQPEKCCHLVSSSG